jgi:hypothetical protein
MRAVAITTTAMALVLVMCTSAWNERDPFRPEIIQFGTGTAELESVLKPLCKKGQRTRPIDPPFLPNVKNQQLQIDCEGFEFMGAPRWAEFVIGDGELKMVWIMVEAHEQDSIATAMEEAYGPPSHRNENYIAFSQNRAAWRFQPAEVLFYSAELGDWITPWFE